MYNNVYIRICVLCVIPFTNRIPCSTPSGNLAHGTRQVDAVPSQAVARSPGRALGLHGRIGLPFYEVTLTWMLGDVAGGGSMAGLFGLLGIWAVWR